MKFASVATTSVDTDEALSEAIGRLQGQLRGRSPQWVMAFVSMAHGAKMEAIAKRLVAAFPAAVTAGCTTQGVLGEGQELTEGASLCLVGATMSEVEVRGVWFPREVVSRPSPLKTQDVADCVGIDADLAPHFIVLADPFTSNGEGLVQSLDRSYPHSVVAGGMVSGGTEPHMHYMFLDGEVRQEGALALALWGDVEVEAVVSQGARAYGDPMVVTSCEGALLKELDGEPALQRVEASMKALAPMPQKLFRQAPLLGVAPSEGVETDYLVRNIRGVRPKQGSLLVGQVLHKGDVIRLHVRDPSEASQDLHERLVRSRALHGDAEGVLAFTCVGRGRGFFKTDNHDPRVIEACLPGVRAGGFFANGELGPVHGQSGLHGYSIVLAIFRTRSWN